MKVVLRHQQTGRYYAAPGQWVRRADNALSFDDTISAHQFLHVQRLVEARPVYRFAPFLIPLLNEQERQRSCANSANGSNAQENRWFPRKGQRFTQN